MTSRIKSLAPVAALVAFGVVASSSANAGEGRGSPHLVAMSATAPSPASRVKMAFGINRGAAGPARFIPVEDKVAAAEPASLAAPAAPATPWYGLDRSLQRGDIVVTETGALVYEGEKGGKRHFRTVGLSRLVSSAERERITESVRR